MAWFRRNRSSPSSELDALREENERLRRANAELERRLPREACGACPDFEGLLVLDSALRSACGTRSGPSGALTVPRPDCARERTSVWASPPPSACDLGEEQAKLLETYDKVSMIGKAMRMTKASEFAAWKEEDFMPLAYRLRHAPIPRVDYAALMAAIQDHSAPVSVELEHNTVSACVRFCARIGRMTPDDSALTSATASSSCTCRTSGTRRGARRIRSRLPTRTW